jgi:hypothetical protein
MKMEIGKMGLEYGMVKLTANPPYAASRGEVL